ncbi:MAG TPA: hypothetical protein VKQ08_11655 [Cyclobacteriaceae bacterium]|nr:hypothetical protein [Cyclobacteriaceae bacterium]
MKKPGPIETTRLAQRRFLTLSGLTSAGLVAIFVKSLHALCST